MLIPKEVSGSYIIVNWYKDEKIVFAGEASSFVDRQMYVFGNYEKPLIDAFVSFISPGKRGTILDIGANVGTHSLAFAHRFKAVHSFEPNPSLWNNSLSNEMSS